MNSPYNTPYRREDQKRMRFMARMRSTLMLLLVLGCSVLIFNSFSAPSPAKWRPNVPLIPPYEYSARAAAPPVWLREYSHVGTPAKAPESACQEEKPLAADLQRITPIEADRKTLERALKMAGE